MWKVCSYHDGITEFRTHHQRWHWKWVVIYTAMINVDMLIFFRGNVNTYLRFLSFYNTEMPQGIVHIYTNGCSCESVKVFETENVSTWGGLEPPTFGFMPNALTYWVIRARHLLSHVFEHWLWRYRYFEVKLTFEMLTVRDQQHSFSTHENIHIVP